MAVEKAKPRRALIPVSPFMELDRMERRFENLFGRSFLPSWWRGDGGTDWIPATDVFEKDDRYVVKMELPGMKEEDIDVSVVGDNLTIKGEKKSESAVEDSDYFQSECYYGSFMRSVPLPSTVDTSKIEASLENGMLEINLPKVAEVKPKKIAVAKGKGKGK